MDNRYLIVLSLFLLGLIGFVTVVVEGSVISSSDMNSQLRVAPQDRVLYDASAHEVMYYNLSKVVSGEDGYYYFSSIYVDQMFWRNSSGAFAVFFDVGGRSHVMRSDVDADGVVSSDYMRGFAGSSDGFVGSLFVNMLAGAFTAIVVGILATVALVSVNVFGSGVGEYGVRNIATIGFYSLLWVMVSAVGVVSLTSIPFFGWVFYVLLSFAYYLGVWGEINN